MAKAVTGLGCKSHRWSASSPARNSRTRRICHSHGRASCIVRSNHRTVMGTQTGRQRRMDLVLSWKDSKIKSSQVKSQVPQVKSSQSVSYFTVPPRAHPSTGSQSGSATPGLTQVPSTRSQGLLNCRK